MESPFHRIIPASARAATLLVETARAYLYMVAPSPTRRSPSPTLMRGCCRWRIRGPDSNKSQFFVTLGDWRTGWTGSTSCLGGC